MNSPVPVVVLAQNFEEGITVTMDDYTAGKTMGSFMGKQGPWKDRLFRCRGRRRRQWEFSAARES